MWYAKDFSLKKTRKNNRERPTNWRMFGAYKHWFTVDWMFVMPYHGSTLYLYFPAHIVTWSAVQWTLAHPVRGHRSNVIPINTKARQDIMNAIKASKR